MEGPANPATETEIDELIRDSAPVAVMTCWARVSEQAIASAPDLQVVARMGVGLDNIAVDAATERYIRVTNVPDYCVEEVSDHAIALILDHYRGVSSFGAAVRAGRWDPAAARLGRVATKTIGVVGFGRIGRRTVEKLSVWGCRVLVADPYLDDSQAESAGVEKASLDDLLSSSDTVVLHVPLTDSNYHLIGRQQLAAMRPGALLVNVSRGGLVDTPALLEALDAQSIGGAALDVLEEEPEVDPRLRSHPSVVVTPHVAFSSDESLVELRTKATQEVIRILSGQPAHYPCNTIDRPAFTTVTNGEQS
ncbi:C-terminal binding protein [Rhodococcus opacus]|uniref:C-terminal binding protein n=1 Tax=Rhodococcus opacus TaxID=37919 RepID=UPI001C209167|nr:C-terminal binding protein [Rhodococcus opacus]